MTRQGKTIIELLVVITVLGAMITPMGRLLHTMMRSEREGAHALAAGASGSRLAREFRSDVHAAREMDLLASEDGPGDLKLIHSDERVVTYVPGDGRIRRIVTRGDKTLSRDSFRLSPGTSHFEILSEPRRVMLIHERHPAAAHPQESAGTNVLRVEAVPGRDYRFAEK